MITFSKKLFIFIYLLLPSLFIAGILSIAGNFSDGIRLGLLSIPGIWLMYKAKHTTNIVWKSITILWWGIFCADALIRSMSWFVLNSDTDAQFIIQAIANTTAQESIEFLQFYASYLTVGILIFIFTLYIYFHLFFKIPPQSLPQSKEYKYVFISLSILALTSYALRPSRAQLPLFYWNNYYNKIEEFKSEIKDHIHVHDAWLNKAQHNLAVDNTKQKQTHVLIISESITSKNLSVCGYGRETTPKLKQHLESLKIYCNAYSPAASTINAMKMLLTEAKTGTQTNYDSESILAYAKAAGFKTFWISNQDDSYISSLFGSFTNQQFYVNHRSGRSSVSLDENILPIYEDVLNDQSPKKLIIVHLIGAHPNYQFRYPSQFSKFNEDSDDAVEQQLDHNGIGYWVQNQRNHYDNSILYQDWLIDRFFTTLTSSNQSNFRSFMYVSDHGNEVGHELDFAGHSPTTQAGYQVPLILWYDGIQQVGANLSKQINTADVDTSLMALMGLHEKDNPNEANFFSQNYQFKPSGTWPYWK